VIGQHPEQVSQITIRDLAGKVVRSYDREAVRLNTVKWDGTDQQGLSLPMGMYLVRMTAGKEQFTRSIMLVK
jgi:flagellar hook assembly protein FlgD